MFHNGIGLLVDGEFAYSCNLLICLFFDFLLMRF